MARLVPTIALFILVVLVLVGLFLWTTSKNGLRLPDHTRDKVSITPATTVSRFANHFVAGLFHNNLQHIGFNLLVFSIGYWLASRQAEPLIIVAAAYGIGIFTVFTLHVILVLPLAAAAVPYAVRALHFPLVGFSVIAYATLGMGLATLPPMAQWGLIGIVVAFEVLAGVFVTGPFISVYHLGGLAMGFYVRWLATVPFRGS